MRVRDMDNEQIIYAIGQQTAYCDHLPVLKTIYRGKDDICMKTISAFNYGYIAGRASIRADKQKAN